MRTVNVDFAGTRGLHALHGRVRDAMAFPAYYGMNLDALWDCLVRDTSLPVTVVFHNTASLTADQKTILQSIIQVFIDAKAFGVELVIT
jgi:ribonuclease inhibitor